ncbi:MAG: 3-methyl-2-oxobutanoate hydroxymethyltransferase [bacterium]
MNLKEVLVSAKLNGDKQAWLTAYDYPTSRLLDEAGIDLLLVGDSLGMVVLGYPDTVDVTMEEMLHHLRAVRRGALRVPVAADLPYGSYHTTDQALTNARRMIDAGAHAVKLEGCLPQQIKTITAEGIEVIGHLGMLPQHVREEGGYHKKGKTEAEAQSLLASALTLQESGCCALVLELVDAPVAGIITEKLDIPTIGIGSGAACDGQILVTPDLLGLQPWFRPAFVKAKADLVSPFRQAIADYIREVRDE